MKVVQVGYGYWGANISRKLMASPKFELRALCEIRPDRAELVVDEMLSIREEIDAWKRKKQSRQ